MPRRRKPERLDAIVAAATAAFIDPGLDHAHIQAIASSASVSVGSVYQHASDKLSLFELAAVRALESPAGVVASLPYRKVPAQARQRLIDDCLDAAASFPQLWVGSQRREHDGSIAEFSGILLEVARWIVRFRNAILLAERNRTAWPELADGFDRIVWSDLVRRLVGYLGPRMRSGALVPAGEPALIARFVLDALVGSLVHRPIGGVSAPREGDVDAVVRLAATCVVGAG